MMSHHTVDKDMQKGARYGEFPPLPFPSFSLSFFLFNFFLPFLPSFFFFPATNANTKYLREIGFLNLSFQDLRLAVAEQQQQPARAATSNNNNKTREET